jgi:predicted small secreted protein
MTTIMKITMLAGATALLLAACNTMEGFGKDLQAAGEKISSSASKSEKKSDPAAPASAAAPAKR